MKTLKFLFIAALFAFVIGLTQTKAQALITDFTGVLDVHYVASDGTQVFTTIEGEVHYAITPVGNEKSEFHGMLPEGVPLPKKAVKYYDETPWGLVYIVITPEGEVNSTTTLKKPKKSKD